MIDLAIDQETGDLFVKDFDLQLVKDEDYIDQHIATRLRYYRGEWFLDTSAGTPYFGSVFEKNPNIPSIENIFIARILETQGVKELLAFHLSLDKKTRQVSLSFKCNTIFGTTEFEKTIFIGN